MTLSPFSAFFVLPAMLLLLEAGRRFRVHHKVPSESPAIEGAIFALFGLLLAFTFSGAVTRWDVHRQLIVEESNDIGVAYLRLDLLPPAAQPALRQLFRDYTTSTTLSPKRSPRIPSICSARSGSSRLPPRQLQEQTSMPRSCFSPLSTR
jgi:hypothetical protein